MPKNNKEAKTPSYKELRKVLEANIREDLPLYRKTEHVRVDAYCDGYNKAISEVLELINKLDIE